MKKITLLLLVLIAGISQVKADDTYTVAGAGDLMGSDWNTNDAANDMTLKEGTTNIYTLTKNITTVAAGTYKFKVVSNHSFDQCWGKDGGGDDNSVVVAEGCTTITFVFNSTTHRNYAYTDKTVFSVRSEMFGWDVDNDMTLKEGTTYTLTKDITGLEAKEYGFKIAIDHTWDNAWGKDGGSGNNTITTDGSSMITFVFDCSTGENSAYVYPSYTVAGDLTEVFGTAWDNTDASNINQMELVRDNTYVLTKSVTLSEDKVLKFKVLKNHSWSTAWPGTGNDDYQTATLPIGTYDVTFIFNLDNNITYAFTSENGINISGNFNDWDANTKMTQDASDVLKYTLNTEFTPTDAIKSEGKWTIEYKLHANGEWKYEINNGSGDNITYDLQEAQKFNLCFTADLGKNTVSLEAKRVVEIGASGMSTIASSHSLDFGKAEDADGNKTLKAYKVTNISKTAATLTEVSNVEYGNGVLLVGTPNTKYTVPFGDGTDDMSDNKLQGAPNGYNVTSEGEVYVLYTDGQFHPAQTGAIPAGKAYLKGTDVPTEAHSLTLVFESETTGVESLNIDHSTFTIDAPMYNLAGQRVTKSYKGVVIQNGKKFINK